MSVWLCIECFEHSKISLIELHELYCLFKGQQPNTYELITPYIKQLNPNLLNSLNRTEQTFKITVTIYLHKTYTYIHPSFSRLNRFVFTHQYSAPPFGRKIYIKIKSEMDIIFPAFNFAKSYLEFV